MNRYPARVGPMTAKLIQYVDGNPDAYPRDIAAALGTSVHSVYNMARREGIALEPQPRFIVPTNLASMVRRYIDANPPSSKRIAQDLGVPTIEVDRVMAEMEEQRRAA